MSFDNRWRKQIYLRNVTGDLRAEVDISGSTVTVDEILSHVWREFGWETCRVVNQGRVLLPGEMVRLDAVNRTFVVVPKRPGQTYAAPWDIARDEGDQASPQEEPEASVHDDALDEINNVPETSVRGTAEGEGEHVPVCRICFGDQLDGELFSPCRCKGSMKYVHVSCLNLWRLSSLHSDAYSKCQQCKFEYNVSMTRSVAILELLKRDGASAFLAVVLLILVAFCCSELVLQVGLVNTGRWSVDYAKPGVIAISTHGALVHLWKFARPLWELRHHVNLQELFWDNPNFVILAGTIAGYSQHQHFRLFVVIGITSCALTTLRYIQRKLKRLHMKWRVVQNLDENEIM